MSAILFYIAVKIFYKKNFNSNRRHKLNMKHISSYSSIPGSRRQFDVEAIPEHLVSNGGQSSAP